MYQAAKILSCHTKISAFICRKEQLSSTFHRRRLLSRCLRAWQQFVKHEQDERQLRKEHDKKTQKMAALLQAAATGRLWSERGGRTNMGLELQDIEDDLAEQSSSTARKLVCFSMKYNLDKLILSSCIYLEVNGLRTQMYFRSSLIPNRKATTFRVERSDKRKFVCAHMLGRE